MISEQGNQQGHSWKNVCKVIIESTDYILCRDKKSNKENKNKININTNFGKITMKWGWTYEKDNV